LFCGRDSLFLLVFISKVFAVLKILEFCFMIEIPVVHADIDNTATWVKYQKRLCDHCTGSCCSLPVEVKAKDLIRLGLMDEFELEEDLKQVVRRLMKRHLVEHFHSKTATFTLTRMASGDCLFLDPSSRRCTTYSQRPDTCRNHPQVGPRSGFCPFRFYG
jgi:Fe-S-cluster containining protein